MSAASMKGYLYSILGGVGILAALLLALVNAGTESHVHLYWEPYVAPTGLVLLLAGLGGIATYFLARLAFHGGMLLFRERRRAAKVRREAEKINRQNQGPSTPESKE